MSLEKGLTHISLTLNGRLNCYLSMPAGLIMTYMVFLLEHWYQVIYQQCQQETILPGLN